MGGESASAWIAKAVRGDHIPESERSQYNRETVYGKGSANICCMQAACDGWYWYHRDRAKARRVLEAWEGYLGLDRWFTSEPWSSHRYGTWINMSYEAVYYLALKLGNQIVAAGLRRYLRFEMFSTILTMGWIDVPKQGYSYARGGSRSWCGWDGPNGKGTGVPYAHLVEEAAIGHNVNNWFGDTPEANWELEPILIELIKKGHVRWGYLNASDKSLCKQLVKCQRMDSSSESDLRNLLSLIEDCHCRFHINVNLIKTNKGTAWVSEKSHGAGSTSFMMGKVWYPDHYNQDENRWVHHEKYDKHFAPIFSANKARRSDPGGKGKVEWDGSKYIFTAWTNAGSSANGYEPGEGKHNDGRDNPRDPDGWIQGPKVTTLAGERIWHVRMVGKTGEIQLIHPPNGSPPPPPPPPDKIDMLEILAPRNAGFAKTTSTDRGFMSTFRDDAGRVFALVKGKRGDQWDWFYWDANNIYHIITEDGAHDDPTAFKQHSAPGVIWCKRFAELGESNVSGPVIHRWANCEQGPAISLSQASTRLHDRSYTAGELGLASNDVPSSTVCYRLDWRWGPSIEHLETFTYAVGWGFLDWEHVGHDTKPVNKRSPNPPVPAVFPCFDVAEWVDEHMRPAPPPPPPDVPPGGWNTIKTPQSAYMKMSNEEVAENYARTGNHFVTKECAVEERDVPNVRQQFKAIIDSWE